METIYEFIKETDEKSKSGKKLNLYKCKICGGEFLKRKAHIKNVVECHHTYKKHNNKKLSKTRLYKIYIGMIERCYNSNNKDYNNYGNRGIKICDEWMNNFIVFYDWSMLNGYQDNLTIDRIDVNGNYEPNNCRWITRKENATFTRKTKPIEVNGYIKSCNQWSKELNKSKNYISYMLNKKGLKYTKNYIKNNM